jgi:hypothetical protein
MFLFSENPEEFAHQYPELIQGDERENEMAVSNGLNFRLLDEGFKYDFNARREVHFPAQVLTYVYLGNAETARNRELLKKHGISYVINVTSDLPNYFEDDGSLHYLRIPVDDTYAHNLAKFFPGKPCR